MQQADTKYVPLSDKARQVILGAILGDGSLKIQTKYSNASLQIRHSEVQKDYLLWKAEMLKEIATDRSIIVQEADGYSKNRKWRFSSKRLPALTELHHLTYKHNTLRIIRTIVAPVGAKRDGTKEQYWRIWIRASGELQKFLRIILPHVPLCMVQKTLLLYKDPQFQQRWISEVVHLSRLPRAAVMAEYEKKKARWNAYR